VWQWAESLKCRINSVPPSSRSKWRMMQFDVDRPYHRQKDMSTSFVWGTVLFYRPPISHHIRVVCFYDRSTVFSERFLYRVRSSASSFKFQYLLFSLRSSSSCLCLLPGLPVPSIFPFRTCIRTQYSVQKIHSILFRYSDIWKQLSAFW
jgi:hypothetical protein